MKRPATTWPSQDVQPVQQPMENVPGPADAMALNAATLSTLCQQLQRHDLASLAQADSMDTALRSWLGPRQHVLWRDSLNAQDFVGALDLLNSLMKEESTTGADGAKPAS